MVLPIQVSNTGRPFLFGLCLQAHLNTLISWYTKFTIHGRPDPNGYTYKLESEVVEEIPEPEPTYIPDKNAEYVVYDTETKMVSDGHEGHVVDVYLVTMDSKGLVINREKKYTDTYKPLTPKVYVGVTPRETPVPADYGLMD